MRGSDTVDRARSTIKDPASTALESVTSPQVGTHIADFVWLERTLAGAPVTGDTFLAWVGMGKQRDALDARQEPAEIGPLVGF